MKKELFIASLLANLSFSASAADIPSGYTKCATSPDVCSFSGTRQVAFGAAGAFVYATFSNKVTCTAASFGGSDPIPSKATKYCSYAAAKSTSPSSASPSASPATATPLKASAVSTQAVSPSTKSASTTTAIPKPPNTSDVKPETITWVWENRIKTEALNFNRLIFDQIYANKGTLKYCIRWESDETVSAAQRDKIARLVVRVVNNWNNQLKGYDSWKYDKIAVAVSGWAVKNRKTLAWSDTDSKVPIYVGNLDDGGAPQCKAGTFNMSLWGTKGFEGGAGGDWGQRVSSTYILESLNLAEPHIIEHEMGHGFNLPDFYDANQFPPTGLPLTIMEAGASMKITPWDTWMLRRVWSELWRAKPSRFGM